jgi:hypothetical protein
MGERKASELSARWLQVSTKDRLQAEIDIMVKRAEDVTYEFWMQVPAEVLRTRVHTHHQQGEFRLRAN